MSDSSPHREPAVQQPDKPCVVCAESIKAAAKKCIRCGAYQDWRRHLEHTQPWVPWLVAVVTTTFAIFAYVSQIVHVPDSKLELSSPHVDLDLDEARFIVANAGDRPGVIDHVGVSIFFKEASGESHHFQSQHAIPPEQIDIIKPGEQRSYQLPLAKTRSPWGIVFSANVPRFLELLHQSDVQGFDRTADCQFSITVRNFRSRRETIDNHIPCHDLVPYVTDYLKGKPNMEWRSKGTQP
jgi:hypothetical protein